MASTNKHHIVSRGFLRHFSEPVPGSGGRKSFDQIRLIFKDDRRDRLVSIRDVFTSKDFNTRWNDETMTERDESLEREWARIESETLPGLRAVVDGDRSEEALRQVRAVMAVHLTRSHAHRSVFDRIAGELLASFPAQMAANSEARKKFRSSYGRDPLPGEIEALTVAIWQNRMQTNQLHVERQVETYQKIVDYLLPLNLEVARPVDRRVGFLIGDVPVTVLRHGHLGAGIHHGIAIMDAEQMFMPLSPWLGVALTTAPRAERSLPTIDVIRVNHLTWRAAVKVVGCHPRLDWRRCLSF